MCLVIFLGGLFFNKNNEKDYLFYVPERYNYALEAFLNIFTTFVLLNIIIPISLLISVEGVKVV